MGILSKENNQALLIKSMNSPYKGEEFFLITNTKKQGKLVLHPSDQVSQS
ncbi:MAG: hypothetical protein KI793_11685 [Rivularia sp. (in: Bacteria)]|nr:hypothetical protein [Rivularia sp. MS3]